jgi:hypothetical protein
LTKVSDLVPVRKKTGEIRLCIDFINMNRAFDKENYSIPPMEQILHLIFGSRMFFLLDEFSGYNWVLIAEHNRIKTTFRTKWGTFGHRRIPFGWINVDATFLREIDIAFKVLISQSVVIYLDNVTMYSKKINDHPHYLKQFFKKCRKYGISLNLNKSVFLISEGKLLGHIISKYGIFINPKHIKAIMQILLLNRKKSM